MTDLYVGEQWMIDGTLFPLDYVKVEISEVMKGEPHSRVPGFVEVQMGEGGPDLDELRDLLPTHDHLWFLMYEPNWAPRDEKPMKNAEIAPFVYAASNEYQGVFREIDGVVRLIQPGTLANAFGSDVYPVALEGVDFADVVDQVRDMAEALPTVPPVPVP